MAEGHRGAAISKLNNVLMQMRKNCNHPDLITSAFDPSPTFPSAEELVRQCGKMQLLERLLRALKAKGHKVLIFSQARLAALHAVLCRRAPYVQHYEISPLSLASTLRYMPAQSMPKF